MTKENNSREEEINELITSLQYGVDREGEVDENVWRNQLETALTTAYQQGKDEGLHETAIKVDKPFVDFLKTLEGSKLLESAREAGRKEGSHGDYGRKLYQGGRKELVEQVKAILVSEMNICRSEGQTTSRLTAAYNRISELLKDTK